MNKGMWFLFGGLCIICLLIGGIVGKKLLKPSVLIIHDTTIISKLDTVWKNKYFYNLIPDTFYTQEIFTDSVFISVDTNNILKDYTRVYQFYDTLISDEQILVTLKEKVSYNKISSRILSYKYKPQPINTVIEVPKKKLSLYMGGEVAVDAFGLTKASIGIGLKDKRDIFYTIDNNFVDGLKLNLGVGVYIPIIK